MFQTVGLYISSPKESEAALDDGMEWNGKDAAAVHTGFRALGFPAVENIPQSPNVVSILPFFYRSSTNFPVP